MYLAVGSFLNVSSRRRLVRENKGGAILPERNSTETFPYTLLCFVVYSSI